MGLIQIKNTCHHDHETLLLTAVTRIKIQDPVHSGQKAQNTICLDKVDTHHHVCNLSCFLVFRDQVFFLSVYFSAEATSAK